MEYKSWHTSEPLPEDKVTKVYYPDTDKKEDSTKKRRTEAHSKPADLSQMQSMGPRKGPEDAKYAHERKDDAGKLHYKFRGKQGNPHHATEHTSPSHHEREHGEDVSFTEADLNDEKPEREEDVETRETEFIKQQREGVRFEQFAHIPVSHAEVRAIAGSQAEYEEMMRDLERMPGGGGVLLHTGAKLYYRPNEDAFFIGMYHHDGSDGRDIVTELEAGKTHLLAGQQHHREAA